MKKSVSGIEKAVAKRVIEQRKALNLTQVQVAEFLDLSKQGYHSYERFETAFSIEYVFKLSRLLGRSAEYLLGLDSDLTPEEDELLTIFRSIPEQARPIFLNVVRSFRINPK